MDRTEIEKKVIASSSIVLKMETAKITPESRFKEDLRITSMKVVMLTALLEDEFGKKFPMARVLKNQTIGDCIDMVIEALA